MKAIFRAALLTILLAGIALAVDEYVHRITITVPAVTGSGTNTMTEADTGFDRIAAIQGGILNHSKNTSQTSTVYLISGSVTNILDTIGGNGTTSAPWSPSAFYFVKVGDRIQIDNADTSVATEAWIWIN